MSPDNDSKESLFLFAKERYLAHCSAFGEAMGEVQEKSSLLVQTNPNTWLVKLRDKQKNGVAIYLLSKNTFTTDWSAVRVYTPAFLRQYEDRFKALFERWKEEASAYFKSGKPTGASVIGAGYCVWVLEEGSRTKLEPYRIIGQPSYYGEGAWGNTGRFISPALRELGLDFFLEIGRMD
jgi:hypothetical protein